MTPPTVSFEVVWCSVAPLPALSEDWPRVSTILAVFDLVWPGVDSFEDNAEIAFLMLVSGTFPFGMLVPLANAGLVVLGDFLGTILELECSSLSSIFMILKLRQYLR